MDHIVLSDEQLNVVAQSHEPIAVHDQQGQLRGFIAMVVGSDELAQAKRVLASKEPRYTTTQVLARLEAQGRS